MYLPVFTIEQEVERSAIKTAVLDHEEEVYAELPHGEGLPREWFTWLAPVDFCDRNSKTKKEEATALEITTTWGFPMLDGRNSTGFPKGLVPLIYKELASSIMIDMFFKRENIAATGLYPVSWFMDETCNIRMHRPAWWHIVGHTKKEACEVFGGSLGERAIPQTKEAYCELQKALRDLEKLIVSVEVKKDYLERKAGYKRYSRLVSLGGFVSHKISTPPHWISCFEVFSSDFAIEYEEWLLEPEEELQARLKEEKRKAVNTAKIDIPEWLKEEMRKSFEKFMNDKGE